MIAAALSGTKPGPLEQTRAELVYLERRAVFRRERISRSRHALRHADALLDLVEQCRVYEYRLVPPVVWRAVVQFVAELDSALRDALGINRAPDHVADVLFVAQAILQARLRAERERPHIAPIIPLFSDQ